MKRRFFQRNLSCLLLILPFFLGLLTACTEGQTNGSGSSGTDEVLVFDTDVPIVRADDGTIDEGLLIPPKDFSIVFAYGVGAKNRYDTVNGKLTKDLVSAGTETADLIVTKNDLAKIYTELISNDILSITEPLNSDTLGDDENSKMIKPVSRYELTVTADGVSYTVEGTNVIEMYPEHPQAARFSIFVDFMLKFISNTPEYRAMPEAEGGYL